MLFGLLYINEDGYLHEEEIIRLITTLNYIICHEEKPIPSDSIINQSVEILKLKEF